METNAKYVRIGIFLLAAIGCVFGFVYWLHESGGLGERSVYRVRFENSVSGLLVGSAVLFNGVRVGDVTELTLDPDEPKHVFAKLSVDSGTPVWSDTRVDIDFQGFTGSPAVSLSGGTTRFEATAANNEAPPLLVAASDAGEDISRSARRVLRKLDRILEDNADPLREGLNDLGTFAKALSRNTDRVNNILAGLERMTGGSGKTAIGKTFDLSVPLTFQTVGTPVHAQLVISEPTAVNALNSNRIAVRAANNELTFLADARWADSLPLLLQTKFVRSLENAELKGVLTQQTATFDADYQLVLDIRNFGIDHAPKAVVNIALSAKIVSRDGRVVSARIFETTRPIPTVSAETITELDQGFTAVVLELVPWVIEAISIPLERQDNDAN